MTGDYIHANYVEGYHRLREYICAQAPKDETAVDFWRMVWQETTVVVVMLTRLIELKRVKCSPYFAEEVGEEKQFGPFHVKTTAKEKYPIAETQQNILERGTGHTLR